MSAITTKLGNVVKTYNSIKKKSNIVFIHCYFENLILFYNLSINTIKGLNYKNLIKYNIFTFQNDHLPHIFKLAQRKKNFTVLHMVDYYLNNIRNHNLPYQAGWSFCQTKL